MYIKTFSNGEWALNTSPTNEIYSTPRISRLSFDAIIPQIVTTRRNITKYRSNTIKKIQADFQSNLLNLCQKDSRFELYLKNHKVKQMKCKYKLTSRLKSCENRSKNILTVSPQNTRNKLFNNTIHSFTLKKAVQSPIILKKVQENAFNKFMNQELKNNEGVKYLKNIMKFQSILDLSQTSKHNQIGTSITKSAFECYPKKIQSQKKITIDASSSMDDYKQILSQPFTIKRKKKPSYQNKITNNYELPRQPTDKTTRSIRPWRNLRNDCDDQLQF